MGDEIGDRQCEQIRVRDDPAPGAARRTRESTRVGQRHAREKTIRVRENRLMVERED